jgi:hypothetical protein
VNTELTTDNVPQVTVDFRLEALDDKVNSRFFGVLRNRYRCTALGDPGLLEEVPLVGPAAFEPAASA